MDSNVEKPIHYLMIGLPEQAFSRDYKQAGAAHGRGLV